MMKKDDDCIRDTGREITSMPVSRETKDRLKTHGQMGQTWDRVLNSVIVDLEKLQAGCCVQSDELVPLFLDAGLAKPVEIGTCKLFPQIAEGGKVRILGRMKIKDEYKEMIENVVSTCLSPECKEG